MPTMSTLQTQQILLMTTMIITTILKYSSYLILPLIPILLYLCIYRVSTSIAADYAFFLSLGPGGTPATATGYMRVKFLSLWALKDPYAPSTLLKPPYLSGRLTTSTTRLPARKGPRPMVAGIAPHRQRTQRISQPRFALLRTQLHRIAAAHPAALSVRTSCLERHGPGLFVVPGGAWGEITSATHCGGEVCHAHPSDGSLHLTLHPWDEAVVLANGWGEMHPLARGGWFCRQFVPARFMMVYAPRDDEELRIVGEIVKAAAWWVGGLEIGEIDENTCMEEMASMESLEQQCC